MYRDRPKSPSITQSTDETRTLRAAMSLWDKNDSCCYQCCMFGTEQITRCKMTIITSPNPETVSVLLMFTCVRSVCSPDRPALYWADRQTEWGRPGPGCTSSPEGMNAAADEKQKHRELYSEILFIYFYSSIWYDVYLYYKWPTILYLNLGYFQGTAIDEQQVL